MKRLLFIVLLGMTSTIIWAQEAAGTSAFTEFGFHPLSHFLFLIPPLAWNAAFTKPLNIDRFFPGEAPDMLVQIENIGRLASFALPLFMPINPGAAWFSEGLIIYGVGLTAYLGAWTVLMVWPESRLASSRIVQLAPAYLPMVWLGGMALMAESPLYAGTSCLFIGLHVAEYVIRWD